MGSRLLHKIPANSIFFVVYEAFRTLLRVERVSGNRYSNSKRSGCKRNSNGSSSSGQDGCGRTTNGQSVFHQTTVNNGDEQH